MICPKCGRRTYKNETVCPKCGTDMTARRIPAVNPARAQVKTNESYSPSEPIQVPSAEVYTSPVYTPPIEQARYTPPAPTPAPKPAPAAPVQEKEDLDRTLTFAAIKESSSIETAAVREYNRMKAQLRESKAADDATKVVLDRLPEGYVYVKMSIDDADRLSKRKSLPKPVLMAVIGAAIITVFLVILLVIVTGGGGSSTPAIIGSWQGEIEPLRFGITGIPFTSVDTIWEFENSGDVKILPQDSLLVGYDLIGTYELSEVGDNSIVKLDLDYYGEKIDIEIIYTVDKETDTLTISNRYNPTHTYTFEKLN